MFYHLFEHLQNVDIPGGRLWGYLSFRSALAIITSLLISLFIGKRIIRLLQKKQIGEVVRDLGLEGQLQKKGTPTMGGIIIIISILVPVLLFANLTNVYILLMITTTVWLGIIGFADDYIKVFQHNKEGLAGRVKILGQVILGIIVGVVLYMSPQAVVREKIRDTNGLPVYREIRSPGSEAVTRIYFTKPVKTTKTTIPFVKNHEFDYALLVKFAGKYAEMAGWIVFILAVIFIITAVSNGANMTDGLDGLATGTSAIIGFTLGIFAYLSGNIIYAGYLNIMYIPNAGELVVFIGAFIGALIGFLWYNTYPAQVFMGDTGSLTLGGIIAVFAIIIRKELLIPILCGIFFIESLSVMMQVGYFKYTRKKYGEGRRIFKMAPLHHHYQMLGYPEAKIVARFWIVQIILAVLTIVTLKIR